MEDYDQHLLLHRLDEPLRILFGTLDEAAAVFITPFLGLGLDHPFWGLWGAGIGVGLYTGIDGGYGAAQKLYVKRGYIPDGQGISYHYQPTTPGNTYTLG